MTLPTLLSLLTTLLIGSSTAKLIGQSVECDPSQMHVFFDFDEDFKGIIYSKEFFAKPGCQVFFF